MIEIHSIKGSERKIFKSSLKEVLNIYDIRVKQASPFRAGRRSDRYFHVELELFNGFLGLIIW